MTNRLANSAAGAGLDMNQNQNKMEAIQNLDIKFQLTNEYLRNGGLKEIVKPDLLQEMINVEYDVYCKPIPESIGLRLRSFMSMLLLRHTMELTISENYQSEYDSLLQKSYSFDQIQIQTKAEFDDIVDKFKDSENILFRGQREASWRLYNRLQRMWIDKRLAKTEDSYVELVRKIIDNGKANHEDEIKDILIKFNIDSFNDVSVLGYMQHHDCPTPLLDWTYNFDIALYFALDNLEKNTKIKEIKDFVSIYYLEEENMIGYKDLIRESIDTVGEQLKIRLIEHIAKDKEIEAEMKEKFKDQKLFDKDRFDGSGLIKGMTEIDKLFGFQISFFSDKDVENGLIFSLNNSANVHNQNGVFILNPSPISPLEVVGKEMYIEANPDGDVENYRFCRCLNINKSLEEYIRNYLNLKGITKQYVYASKDINTWPIFEMSLKK